MSDNDVFALYLCTEKNEYVCTCVCGGGGGGGKHTVNPRLTVHQNSLTNTASVFFFFF